MAHADLYLNSFLLLLYCKIFIIPNLLSYLGAFVNLFPRLAICSVVACKIEFRDVSILLKLVFEKMCVFLE